VSDDQLALAGMPRSRSAAGQPRKAARRTSIAGAAPDDPLPVARVAVLTALPHLDRLFDYSVPSALSDATQPGVRVRVRLGGRLHDGYVLDRVAEPQEPGRQLQQISSVHGPPVLTAEIAQLCRAVADRYAGTFADVVRAAVPPRHARVEARFARAAPVSGGLPPSVAAEGGVQSGAGADQAVGSSPGGPGSSDGEATGSAADTGPPPIQAVIDRSAWRAYRGGAQLVTALAAVATVRASWLTGPGEDVPTRVAELCALVSAGGRGALVVGPDVSDVQAVVKALAAADLPCVNLSARSGPEARYRAFLRVLTGEVRVVVGTRGAVFAPVARLGLVVVLQDGDDSLAEPHAPGWHAREVAALRSVAEDASLVLAGPAVSLEAERMVAVGWATPLGLPRTTLRARAPLVQSAAQAAHDDPASAAARIPGVALEVLREAIDRGPVLVSVPRAGYLPFLVCDTCREQVLCPDCASPMRAHGPGLTPACADHPDQPPWRCPHCGGQRIRAGVVGVRRTAEEFGRALPGVPVHTSSGDTIVRSTPPRRALVVATPGAEPDPGPEGYATLVLLDVGAALTRPGLRVGEEVLRRWLSAAALVRPASAGGRVLVVGDEGLREVQALVRWDPRGYAHRELDERLVLALPPAVRTARLTGPESEVKGVVEHLQAELGHRLRRSSGPLAVLEPSAGASETGARASWVVGVSLSDGPALTSLLQQIAVRRSMRGSPVVRVRVDPVTT
jgi:primosomal protein N' (replication factor Y)